MAWSWIFGQNDPSALILAVEKDASGVGTGGELLAELIPCVASFEFSWFQAIERHSCLFSIHVEGEVFWSSSKDRKRTLVWASEWWFVAVAADVYMTGTVWI